MVGKCWGGVGEVLGRTWGGLAILGRSWGELGEVLSGEVLEEFLGRSSGRVEVILGSSLGRIETLGEVWEGLGYLGRFYKRAEEDWRNFGVVLVEGGDFGGLWGS